MMAGTAALGPLLADQTAAAISHQVWRREQELRTQPVADHRHAGHPHRFELRLSDHPDRHQPGRIRPRRGPRCGQRRHGARAEAAYRGQESAGNRAHPGQGSQLHQPAALWRRLQRARYRLARYCGQGLRSARLAADRLPVSQPHSLLLRYHGKQRSQNLCRAHDCPQEDRGSRFSRWTSCPR